MNSLQTKQTFLVVAFATLCLLAGLRSSCNAQGLASKPAEKIRVLIVDGQNNHSIWPKTTEMMRSYLLETKLFSVDLARTAPKGVDEKFAPEFSKYDVVVSNYNGESWPEGTKKSFEKFVSDGGGFVVIHAADNAFSDWPEYNRMIGLGGWGNRTEQNGPYVYFNAEQKMIRDAAKGNGGSHGAQHEFVLTFRNAEHPITKGLPEKWLHAQDELYDRLRGPAEDLEVLATAFSAKEQGGTDRHEPMAMVVSYGQGRVFHTTLGHADYSQACVGFITLLTRGTEWAATGKVSQAVPTDFPTETTTSSRQPAQEKQDKELVPDKLGNTPNVSRFGNIFLAGQMTPDDLDALKQRNVTRVISLRAPEEIRWNEKEWAENGGLKFNQFSCNKASELSDDSLAKLFELLDAASENEKVVLHCGKAGRVGAIWALYRVNKKGIPQDQAMAEAKAIGLNSPSLEKDVADVLSKKNN